MSVTLQQNPLPTRFHAELERHPNLIFRLTGDILLKHSAGRSGNAQTVNVLVNIHLAQNVLAGNSAELQFSVTKRCILTFVASPTATALTNRLIKQNPRAPIAATIPG